MSAETSAASDGYQWKKLGAATPLRVPGAIQTDVAQPGFAEPPPSQQEQGYEDGHAAGYRDGAAKAAAEQQAVLTQLQGVLDEVARLREKTIGDCFEDVAVALHTIFKQVFLHELKTSPELIASLAVELKQILQAETMPRVILSREDYTSLSALASEELLANLDVDNDLPAGVLRASAGKSMIELDVVANLEQVLVSATAAPQDDDDE